MKSNLMNQIQKIKLLNNSGRHILKDEFMTLEECIEELMDFCYDAYRKASRGCEEANKLMRKIPVIIDGHEFSCWREYTTYKACQFLQEKCPNGSFTVNLNGNDSNIEAELSDEDSRILMSNIYSFLKRNNIID